MVSPSARQIVSAPARRCIWHLPWFVGTVTAAQPVPEAWDFLDGVNYTVRVDSKIHGKARPNTEVTVFSENSPRFFAMYVGQQYVLYLQPQYGRNQVDNCGNSHATTERLCIDQTAEADRRQGFLSLQDCPSALERGTATRGTPSLFTAEAFRFPVHSWPLPAE